MNKAFSLYALIESIIYVGSNGVDSAGGDPLVLADRVVSLLKGTSQSTSRTCLRIAEHLLDHRIFSDPEYGVDPER
jgi:hypothetical protein